MNLPQQTLPSSALREGTVCLLSEEWKDEISEDYLLPDSMPDVKKILSVSFEPAVHGSVCEKGGARISGECGITLLYMSDTGRLKKAGFTAPFTLTGTGKEGIEADSTLLLSPRITRSDCRMLSPRKFSVRAGLSVSVTAFGTVSLAYSFEGEHAPEDAMTVECEECDRPALRLLSAEKNGIPFRTELELEANLPGIGEIVDCRLLPRVPSVTVRGGEGQIEGELTFLCLYETENNRFARLKKVYTLNESLPLPEGEPSMHGIASIRAESLRAAVQNNSYGERRVIEIDADISLSMQVTQPKDVRVTRDLYSTACEAKTGIGQTALCIPSPALSSSCSVNVGIPRKESGAERAGVPLDGTVLLTSLAARYDEEKKKIVAEGTAEVTVFAELQQNEDEGRDFVSAKGEQTFRCELDPRGFVPDRMIVRCGVTPPVFRADETTLYADFEVCLTVLPLKEERVDFVRSVALDRTKPWQEDEETSLLLYYPDREDTVWQIAKRYHIPSSSLLAANGMTGEELTKKVLLIPVGQGAKAAFSGIL